ncbi:MAG: hypothetical protein WAQ27_05465 [Candidatus Microsaccharimonas sp.]
MTKLLVVDIAKTYLNVVSMADDGTFHASLHISLRESHFDYSLQQMTYTPIDAAHVHQRLSDFLETFFDEDDAVLTNNASRLRKFLRKQLPDLEALLLPRLIDLDKLIKLDEVEKLLYRPDSFDPWEDVTRVFRIYQRSARLFREFRSMELAEHPFVALAVKNTVTV